MRGKKTDMDPKPNSLVQCDHARQCPKKDCPHRERHRVVGIRQCDVAYTYCKFAKKDGAVCEEVRGSCDLPSQGRQPETGPGGT